MTLVKEPCELFDPFAEFKRLEDEIFELCDFMQVNGDRTFKKKFSTALDIRENARDFTLQCDLEGFEQGAVDVTIHGNILCIEGRKKQEKKLSQSLPGNEIRIESFLRAFTLPRCIAAEKIRARCHKGVLTVILPKQKLAEPTHITIEQA